MMFARRILPLLFLAAGLAPAAASATDVTMHGSIGYDVSGSQVTITVDQIVNNSSDTRSGTLYLTLWATTSSSPTGSGYELAQVALGELEPNEYYYDVVQTTGFSAPPDGTYYIHLLLSEYPALDSYIDSITFSGTQTFDSGGSGGGGDGGSGGDGGDGGSGGGSDSGGSGGGSLEIRGDVILTYTGGFIDEIAFEGEFSGSDLISIYNGGSSHTGNLKIRVVASEDPYSGGTITGYRMADYDLPEGLPAGSWYADFVANVEPLSTHPEYGDYYVYVLVMEQASDGEYYIDTWAGSGELRTLGCGSSSSCLGGGSDGGSDDSGGSGGGGAIHPLFLLLALAGFRLVSRRRRAL